ncbi:MAG TPA: thiamine-phosphate kinase [Pirellulaceae bacterium]|nr:thiamine-phosphate kinase [Pirellulaceae bacterium]
MSDSTSASVQFYPWNTISRPVLQLGIGDDAAIINVGDQGIVLTTDALIEGVHFDASLNLQQIGRKALAVNLSDLAAMAAWPYGFLVTLCLPKHFVLHDVQQLFLGMQALIDEFELQIMGGDTNVGSSQLIISITALGTVDTAKAWRMDGASPGDRILVSGSFGGSRSEKHFNFEPRCQLAYTLNQQFEIVAATDVSDGLAIDLHRLAQASNVGFVLESHKIPISNNVATGSDSSRLLAALGDGEDFELIIAARPNVAAKILKHPDFAAQLCDVGEFTNTYDVEHNCLLHNHLTGSLEKLAPIGYVH